MSARDEPEITSEHPDDVVAHLRQMVRLITESRERMDQLEAYVRAIVVQTQIIVHERPRPRMKGGRDGA